MDLETLIADVRDKVGAVISKPKMADKLLSKPPFRFLHDTISAINATTGFAEGLYSGEELDSAAITERQAKIDYLDKIFNTVGICKGAVLDIRAAKVVAGLEPENTNMFLLALVECATDSTYDSAAAVSRCLAGEKAGEGKPAKKSEGARLDSGRSESKAAPRSPEIETKRVIEESKSEAKDDSEPQPLDRGRSRSGTRGGKPVSSALDSAGLGMANESFPNLDREIEACDGSEATTQTLLGEIISKPKLTEKLLAKPPFRFLHDIISEVTRVTGFSSGLYTAEELDSANVAEKSQKTLYLEKLVKLIGVHLNTVVEARPSKIIAGLEAQNTNVLLQLLAVAAKHRPESTRSVAIALEQLGLPPAESGGGGVVAPAPTRETAESKPEERPREKKSRPIEEAEEKPAVAKPVRVSRDVEEDAGARDSGGAQVKEEAAGDANASADPEAKRSMRPTTARRRPPKVTQGAKEVNAQDAAVAVTKKAEGLIVDGQNDDDEVEEAVEDTERLGDDFRADAKTAEVGDPQSKLVKDIRSRAAAQEREAQGGGGREEKDVKGEGGEDAKAGSGGIRLGRLKKTGTEKAAGGSSSLGPSDMEKLRGTIQMLVQHTGPLGSCMDFIQEDVGVMTAELRKWEEDCVKYETRLEEERAKTHTMLKPLNMELLEITEQLNEQQERIASLKASIARKEDRIVQNLKQIVSA